MTYRPLEWPQHLGESLLRSLVMTAMAHPQQVAGGSLAIAYGLRNPSTRAWTIRMCCAYGKNTAQYLGKQFSDTVLISWSESFGEAGIKRRATARAASKRTATKIVGKRAAKKAVARAAAKKMLVRAIPVVGWAILLYDIADYLIGDDPSFFGDIEYLIFG